MFSILAGGNAFYLLAISVAFIITFIFVPITARVAKAKGIVAHENGRTSHKGSVPTMGGLAIFSGFYLTVLLFVDSTHLREFNPFCSFTPSNC